MKNTVDTLIKWKTEREVNERDESHDFRLGYVKAMNDAINLVKNLNEETVEQSEICSCLIPNYYYSDLSMFPICRDCGKRIEQIK